MGDLSKLPPPERMPLLDDDVTLRDRFAMAALPGVYAHWHAYHAKHGGAITNPATDEGTCALIGEDCYAIADAMMRARK